MSQSRSAALLRYEGAAAFKWDFWVDSSKRIVGYQISGTGWVVSISLSVRRKPSG